MNVLPSNYEIDIITLLRPDVWTPTRTIDRALVTYSGDIYRRLNVLVAKDYLRAEDDPDTTDAYRRPGRRWRLTAKGKAFRRFARRWL